MPGHTAGRMQSAELEQKAAENMVEAAKLEKELVASEVAQLRDQQTQVRAARAARDTACPIRGVRCTGECIACRMHCSCACL